MYIAKIFIGNKKSIEAVVNELNTVETDDPSVSVEYYNMDGSRSTETYDRKKDKKKYNILPWKNDKRKQRFRFELNDYAKKKLEKTYSLGKFLPGKKNRYYHELTNYLETLINNGEAHFKIGGTKMNVRVGNAFNPDFDINKREFKYIAYIIFENQGKVIILDVFEVNDKINVKALDKMAEIEYKKYRKEKPI
jgi:hypothetical protein